MSWNYSESSRRYHDSDTGRFLSQDQQKDLRDSFIATRQEATRALSADLSQGRITLPTWEQGMRDQIRISHVDLAALGRGGREMMEPRDWGRVGSEVKAQYGYLSQFSAQISRGELSEAQISARAAMYPGAATTAYEVARARSYDLDLPGMPGEDVECGANCRCTWEYEETEDGIEATWVAQDDSGTCEDCARNASEWAPWTGGMKGGHPMKVKRKVCELADFKMSDEGAGSFTGYASTFGNKDCAGEVVVKGAFARTLPTFKADGFVAVGHNWSALPVATVRDAKEDDHGLFVAGDFHSTSEAQSARTVMKERLERGKSVGLSIGYEVKDSEQTKEARLLKEIDLYEFSIVTVPCNREAQATTAKSAEPEFKAQYLGDYIEGSMTLAALSRLVDALFYSVVYDTLFEDKRPLPERLDTLRAAFDEFRDIALRAIGALMEGVGEEAGELEPEFSALFPKPGKTSPSALLAGLSYEQQLDVVLATAEAVTVRGEEIAEKRAEEGRGIGKARLPQIAALKARLDNLLPEEKGLEVDAIHFSPDDLTVIRLRHRERTLRLLQGCEAP